MTSFPAAVHRETADLSQARPVTQLRMASCTLRTDSSAPSQHAAPTRCLGNVVVDISSVT